MVFSFGNWPASTGPAGKLLLEKIHHNLPRNTKRIGYTASPFDAWLNRYKLAAVGMVK